MSRPGPVDKVLTTRRFRGRLEGVWRLRAAIRSMRALRLARFDPLDGELDHHINETAEKVWP